MEDIKNISRGHQFEGDAIAQLERIIKCKTARCEFFHFTDDVRHSSSPDVIELLGVLLEVKIKGEGSLFPLESSDKIPQY